ncbi:ABC transporter substrate-binding protein [Amycolatopsis viridis]|uniref:Iron complex transport system substrate-binding protein n=1 Tax=Amycolatopsis viridis TaxID=185678 RepID=A0ABX0T165_9PSEU|nr:iron-siderophore ABC transporter substrate-binding protein [Amycolatopsis viridis]NIH82982.1 iron complex transport system substrate-binding protein [Amycolatopsis viridis]
MTRPWRAALALAVTACLTLTACSGGAGESAGQGGASQAGYPRTIQHAMGSTVLKTQPKTVAALDTSYVDAAFALETQVVAYTKYRNYDQLPEYLGDDRGFGAGAKVVGPLESPDVEQLYDVKPDVIVSAKVRHEKYYDQFTGVAPTVFSTTTGASWKDNIRLLARVLGKESLAEQKIGAYEQRAQRIGQEITAKLGRTPTVSIVRFVEGEPTVRLYSSASYPGVVMADARLSRPAGQPDTADKISVNLSQEDIAKLDADVIFVSSYSDETKTAEDPKAKFQANPLWATLKGKIVDVPDTTWFSAVSLQGASAMLTDLANQFGVTP